MEVDTSIQGGRQPVHESAHIYKLIDSYP